jgi:hypothetical protein
VNGPPDLRDLLGDDVPDDERARLEAVDALLRSVPAPPARVPPAVESRVLAVAAEPRHRAIRPRALAGTLLAAAAVVVAVVVAVAVLGRGGGLDAAESVALAPAAGAPAGPSGVVRLGEPDEQGNGPLELTVSGLARAAAGHYELGLIPPGGAMFTCGWFEAGPDTTVVRMSVPYEATKGSTWVVTVHADGGSTRRLLVGREASDPS